MGGGYQDNGRMVLYKENVPCYKVGGVRQYLPPLPSPLDPLKGNGIGFLLHVCVWPGLARITTTPFHFLV